MDAEHNKYVECFEFLDRQRETGAVNMLHGGQMLEISCGLDRKMARKVFADWMRTFDSDVSAFSRAEVALNLPAA